jgi:hypothetical protein
LKNFKFNWITEFYRLEIRCFKLLFLFQKCAKTQLRTSAIPKFFSGDYTPDPVKGEGRDLGGKGKMRIGGEGMEIMEGRKDWEGMGKRRGRNGIKGDGERQGFGKEGEERRRGIRQVNCWTPVFKTQLRPCRQLQFRQK